MEKEIYSGTGDERFKKEQPAGLVVTPAHLKHICPAIRDKAIDVYLPYINRFSVHYEVNTKRRMASFLAQLLHETMVMKYIREIWGPTEQQRRYERDFKHNWAATDPVNKLAFDLGNAGAGDGKYFSGRGGFMITGRANYRECSRDLFGDDRLLRNPDLLTVPEYAIQSAFWFWKKKNLNKAADTPGILDDRKLVNGGKNGLKECQAYFDLALEVL